MLSKVAQVLSPINLFPLRASHIGWLLQNLNQTICAPFMENILPKWNTSSGNLNNEFKQHKRYRYRF